jgi:hypothetical protein
MARQAAEFDAQCDLAALVYDKSDEADRLLRDFVSDLASRGHRIVGLIQTRRHPDGVAVTVLPSGETIPLSRRSDVAATSTGVAPCDLAEPAARVDVLIESGADLLIVNRFGRLEAEGAGLVNEIVRAADLDIPVVVAVPEFRFLKWLTFCNGMGVKLACRDGSLQRWWRTMIVGGKRAECLPRMI